MHTIRCVYRNQASDKVEEISPSSKSTPREKKKRLGPVTDLSRVDDSVFCIRNAEGDSINLSFKNLRPSILVGGDPLKETLIGLQEKSLETLLSVMKRFLVKFDEESADVQNSQSDMFANSQEVKTSTPEKLSLIQLDSGIQSSQSVSVDNLSAISGDSGLVNSPELSIEGEKFSPSRNSETVESRSLLDNSGFNLSERLAEESDNSTESKDEACKPL